MTADPLKDVPDKRWEIAQKSERIFWEGFTMDLIKEINEKYYSFRAKEFKKLWDRYITLNNKTKILQIGCGPLDVINYVDFGKRFAIDPLADYYKERFGGDDSGVKFIHGIGEKLPFKDEEFDVILILNVLDHVKSAEKVLSECERVLKRGGIFHLENNVYSKRLFFIAKTWKIIQEKFFRRIFNINHPYMLRTEDLERFIRRFFEVKYEYYKARMGEKLEKKEESVPLSKKIRRKILSLLGMKLGENYMCIAIKN